jgi:hypothetical protein
MTKPDSAAVPAALLAALRADATLAGLMPDGVWLDLAPPGLERFVIVSLLDHRDVPTFEGRAIEDGLYLVKAVARATSADAVQAAAAAIDARLEDGDLTIDGFVLMTMYREAVIDYLETVNDDPAGVQYAHRGGRYRIQASIG